MTAYPRGSEWRKWDLHLHAPGTKLSDGYGSPADWDRFCGKLESSEVAAFGITDYFSFDGYYEVVEQFYKRYPGSEKVIFPNLELRLNETINKDLQQVDLHLLLRPGLDRHVAARLLHDLKTEVHDGTRRLSCAELNTRKHFESATVTRPSVFDAIESTFGTGRQRKDNVILIVPAGNSGIRVANEQQRKANLADVIDGFVDATFGSDANADWFARADRFRDGSPSIPKPVFSGCDAHSFDQLEDWLGSVVTTPGSEQTVTWIKADVTFDGLLQTLVEPLERVRIQPTRPDQKAPYKVISRVRFTGTDDFPPDVEFNCNLVAIIGSRSSGKSALLAYIAHAIDPEYTVEQQMATGLFDKKTDVGPAAAMTWDAVADTSYTVEWADPTTTDGKIIYIPQNSLFALSGRPNDVTAKIQPALYRLSPQYRVAFEQAARTVESENAGIRKAVREWFRLSDEVSASKARLRDYGDKKAIEATRVSLETQIQELRKQVSLSDEDVAAFESLTITFRDIDARLGEIEQETAALSPYVQAADGALQITTNVEVEVRVRPLTSELPVDLGDDISKLVSDARTKVLGQVAGELIGRQASLDSERAELGVKRGQLKVENKDLIARNTANAQIEELIRTHEGRVAALAEIAAEEAQLAKHVSEQAAQVRLIEDHFAGRRQATQPLAAAFQTEPNDLDGMSFGFEEGLESDFVDSISDRFNKQERSIYVDTETRVVDIDRAQREPAAFLAAVSSGEQKLKRGVDTSEAAVETLRATPAIRFYARLDGDRIGGFERSSMTPGKQALFALTLTLSESDEAWPLLIDQPEDDLDSRAIYDTIVPYLKERKRERQILMVTHNANLVVGADSEQVVVTNRHGDDRKNREGRTFAYLTGSLEQSSPLKEAEYVLDTGGIREHACEILDGGEEAFRKRRDKYNL